MKKNDFWDQHIFHHFFTLISPKPVPKPSDGPKNTPQTIKQTKKLNFFQKKNIFR